MKSTEKILEEIFDTGRTSYEFKIADKYEIEVRNITAEDYISIDKALAGTKRTAVGYAQEFIVERLSRIITKIQQKPTTSIDDTRTKLLSWPSPLLTKISEEHKKFELQIKKALELEEIEDNFFDKGVSQEKQKQS